METDLLRPQITHLWNHSLSTSLLEKKVIDVFVPEIWSIIHFVN